MKSILIGFFCFLSVVSFGQGPAQFSTVKHSFGKIKQNVPASYVFTFKNTTSKPIVIEVATAECGCTTPEYPKAPIAKGQEGKIKVTYNAVNPGTFTKKVHVKFAGEDQPVTLEIDGEVVTAK